LGEEPEEEWKREKVREWKSLRVKECKALVKDDLVMGLKGGKAAASRRTPK